MIKGEKNKMVGSKDTLQKGVGEEYHFAGEQTYEPQTVIASSVAEATEIWEKTRKPVGGTSTKATEPEPESDQE